MKPIQNPANRFSAEYVEWIDEPPPARLEVFEETATREILASNNSPDVGFTYSLNPYRGCAHACAYCYARPTHEYLGYGAGTDFETRIVAKMRAPALLRAKLGSKNWAFDTIAFSGDTDCYQPIEASYGLTRACLEACLDFANPVILITKSCLIKRDVKLIAELARRAPVTACFSIPFSDPDLARAIEPGAPRPAKRLEAMKILSDAGVRTGVLVAPIIPGLNDKEIPAILEAAKEAGASFASRVLLRLPHSVKDIFLERVRAALPDRAGRIEARIREVRGGELTNPNFGERHRGHGVYWDLIEALFDLHARRLGLSGSRPDGDAMRREREHMSGRVGEQIGLFSQ